VYGYGNPGRQDDGAGVALVEELAAGAEHGGLQGLTCDTNYQLNVEDALTAARHDTAIFVDASRDQQEGFLFRPLRASTAVSFTTHAVAPESVISLAGELYGAHPRAYLLTIRGYEWEPNGVMTPGARANIEAAKAFLVPFLEERGKDGRQG
jgi:hydrogenase maturation protease